MPLTRADTTRLASPQFSLLEIFEFTTICSVICALIPVVGLGSALLLMLTTLAVTAGQGGLAVLALGSAVMVAPLSTSTATASPSVTMATAAALALWVRWRQHHRCKQPHLGEKQGKAPRLT